jgi:hypothetical protein
VLKLAAALGCMFSSSNHRKAPHHETINVKTTSALCCWPLTLSTEPAGELAARAAAGGLRLDKPTLDMRQYFNGTLDTYGVF